VLAGQTTKWKDIGAFMTFKQTMMNKVVRVEILGFLAAILACWLTEWFDPPFSYQQVLIESLALLILGWSIVHWTIHSIEHIRELEGFILMCATCKSVKVDGKWERIEQVLGYDRPRSISHGICPTCLEKFQKDFKS